MVFGETVMKERLRKDVYKSLKDHKRRYTFRPTYLQICYLPNAYEKIGL